MFFNYMYLDCLEEAVLRSSEMQNSFQFVCELKENGLSNTMPVHRKPASCVLFKAKGKTVTYLYLFLHFVTKNSRQRDEKDRELPTLSNYSEMSSECGNWQLI